MHKLLVIADRPDWAFAKIGNALQRYMTGWEVIIRYGHHPHHLSDHAVFDVVFYLLDYVPAILLNARIPANKVALGIRSHVLENKNPTYIDTAWLSETAGALVVANEKLFNQFTPLHPAVFLAPGGTDTTYFIPGEKKINRKPIVGWAGSRKNFGYTYRGLDIIEKACEITGMQFLPAFREDRWRTTSEMLRYYQEDIDIYVDMSIYAGRQNGLLEAGACAKTLIASDAGIAAALLKGNQNGFLIERNVSALVTALCLCSEPTGCYGINAHDEIARSWSWEVQIPLFRKAFEFLLTNSLSGSGH